MVRRLGEYRDRPVGPGPGDKMLAAMTAWEWALTGGGADECVAAGPPVADRRQRRGGRERLPHGAGDHGDGHGGPGRGGRALGPPGGADAGLRLALRRLVRAPVERHHPDPPRRAGRGRGAAAHRPGRAVHVGPAAGGRGLLLGHDPAGAAGAGRRRGGTARAGRAPLPHLRPPRRRPPLAALRDRGPAGRGQERGGARALGGVRRGGRPAGQPRLGAVALAPGRRPGPARPHRRGDHPGRGGAGARAPLGRAGHGRPQPAGAGHAAPRRRAGAAGRGGGACSSARRPGWSWRRRWRRQGATLRRERKPTDAREPLRRALELAELCDAGGLAAEVRTELYATGSRPRPTP